MALEDAINALALAINRHTDVLAGAKPMNRPEKPPTEEVVKEVAGVEATEKKPAKVTTVEAPAEVPSKNAVEDTTDAAVDVSALRDRFARLVENDTPKAKEVLTKMGFPKFNLIPANLHAKLQDLVDSALGEIDG